LLSTARAPFSFNKLAACQTNFLEFTDFRVGRKIFLSQPGAIGTLCRGTNQISSTFPDRVRLCAMRIGAGNVNRNFPRGSFSLDSFGAAWEIPKMKTLTVDDQKRIRIPDAKPRQVFAYENHGNGRLTLVLVKAEAQEPFPPGSLKKYVTPDRDAEMLDLLKGCSLEVSD
jgi:hypothetical protein